MEKRTGPADPQLPGRGRRRGGCGSGIRWPGLTAGGRRAS